MKDVSIRLTEEQLAEMDRILSGEKIRGPRWLQHAVAIYKDILVLRQDQLDALRDPRAMEVGRTMSCLAH